MSSTFCEETHWEKAAKTRMGKYLTQVETTFIFSSIDPSQFTAIVDIGAEAGRFSMLTENINAMSVSLDIESHGLKRLRLKTKSSHVIQADARRTPFKDGIFDAVFMIEVLDYIAESEEALRECHRIMKPGASLFISFGNKSSFKAYVKKLRGKSYMHSYKEITHLLLKTPLNIKRVIGYNWLPFGRMSENRLIPFLAFLEWFFGFRRIPRLSPWVIMQAVKNLQ
ncbi:MAG: class I SAM-dependent methyltransferase [Candidatus Bathyarchaeia archaeon]